MVLNYATCSEQPQTNDFDHVEGTCHLQEHDVAVIVLIVGILKSPTQSGVLNRK